MFFNYFWNFIPALFHDSKPHFHKCHRRSLVSKLLWKCHFSITTNHSMVLFKRTFTFAEVKYYNKNQSKFAETTQKIIVQYFLRSYFCHRVPSWLMKLCSLKVWGFKQYTEDTLHTLAIYWGYSEDILRICYILRIYWGYTEDTPHTLAGEKTE